MSLNKILLIIPLLFVAGCGQKEPTKLSLPTCDWVKTCEDVVREDWGWTTKGKEAIICEKPRYSFYQTEETLDTCECTKLSFYKPQVEREEVRSNSTKTIVEERQAGKVLSEIEFTLKPELYVCK